MLNLGNSPSTIRGAGDIIVLPLANQLGRHMKLGGAAERLQAIDLPIIGIGLGAQATSYEQDVELDPGTRSWLEQLATRAPSDHPNIGARGPYTKEQIAKLGFGSAATVTGCPSNFICGDAKLGDRLAAGFAKTPKRIAVAAGIPYIAQLADIERQLADIVTLTDGAYIVQHGLEMIELACREFDTMASDKLELCRSYIQPLSSMDEFKAWCSRFAFAFSDVRPWMDFVRRFDFVVGTRFHGAMLAIQAGVPAACIAHDSRTLEMCQTMQIPVCHYKDINVPLTRYNIMDFFKFDAEAYTETRRRLCGAFVDILKAAELDVAPGVLRLLN
nr:polysaccharide pyruvyl transferase family protein [Siccirubricoccus soli]